MLRVFIGYDHREAITYSVLAHSIQRHATQPAAITPLALNQLKSIYTRDRNPLQSTDFSFTRFLTPFLSNFEGWSLFMDCDMIVMDDIANLFSLADDRYAVQVVKHDHTPKEETKFLGAPQSKYQKKNWSSVMLFNNAKCKTLTPEYVNTATGLELHQFKWLESDDLIGEIPHRWNHLVGYDEPDDDVSLVHFTVGGPYFNEYKDCEYAKEWLEERNIMENCEQKI
ncbi:MAG: glycosyltransferase [Gammaproteobacteria bacterium]|nr:glycosyltransferase [Gammaproteobacteria bacterium]